MNRNDRKTRTPVIAIGAILTAAACSLALPTLTTRAAAPATQADAEPVEPRMHEFMEYLFQPSFKRLKAVMAEQPADNQGWKAIRAEALVLAEGGNLLLQRTPKEDAADWNKHSVQVRDFGGQLYRAAKAKDFAMARQHYRSMVQNCNACHDQFAGGDHMLEE